jgi:hypothetical protein
MTDVAERLRAAGLAVKPLEWQEVEGADDDMLWEARARPYGYAIGCDRSYWWQDDDAIWTKPASAPTLEAAKAAAQADYEARVLAALCSTLERSAHTPPEQGLGPDDAETRSDTGR